MKESQYVIRMKGDESYFACYTNSGHPAFGVAEEARDFASMTAAHLELLTFANWQAFEVIPDPCDPDNYDPVELDRINADAQDYAEKCTRGGCESGGYAHPLTGVCEDCWQAENDYRNSREAFIRQLEEQIEEPEEQMGWREYWHRFWIAWHQDSLDRLNLATIYKDY